MIALLCPILADLTLQRRAWYSNGLASNTLRIPAAAILDTVPAIMTSPVDGEFRPRGPPRMPSGGGSSSGDVPRPLHITKRSAAVGRSNRIARNPRSCSPGTEHRPGAATDSPPPPRGTRPLAVPKRRTDRDDWPASRSHLGCSRDKDRAAGPAYGLSPPTPCPPEVWGAVCSQLRDGAGTAPEDDVDWNPPRRRETTLSHPAAPCDWEDARSTQTPEADSPTGSPPRQSLSEAHGLAPRIVVTPDCAAADESTAYIWAAVQLSTQVGRHGAPGGSSDDPSSASPLVAPGELEMAAENYALKRSLMFQRRSAMRLSVRCIGRNTANNKQHNLGGHR